MQPRSDQLQDTGTADYQIKRGQHPPITLYWIGQSEERGRPVKLYGLSCIFCQKTLAIDFKGHIAMIVNVPVSLMEFRMAMTIKCRQCRQQYRLVIPETFMG